MTPLIKEYARRRRSIRRFKQTPVPMEVILNVLDTARYAPSGANEQPWRFIVVTDPETKRNIRLSSEKGEKEMYSKVSGKFKDWLKRQGLNPDKPFLEEAPVLIVVLMKAGAMYARESTWIAIGYILLALEEEGYCTVPYTPSNTSYPLDDLAVPKEYRIEAILPIGLPDDDSPRKDRVGLDTLVYLDNWGKKLEI